MSEQQIYGGANGGANWFKRFIVFLLAVVVAISLGLLVYYFLQDDETLGLDKSVVTINKGDTFTLTIIHENPNNFTEYSLVWDNSILECDNEETADTVYEFTALAGGATQISLETTNAKYQNMYCTVNVGSGTQTNPFYIKTAEDLASIGTGNLTDDNYRSLSAYYLQMNSIDLVGYAWTPIGANVGFSGNYDGAGYTIYNLSVIANVNSNVGLFTIINPSGSVSRIVFSNALISGYAKNAGVVAGINNGTVTRIEVHNSTVSSLLETTDAVCVGGIVGQMVRTTANTRLDRVAFYDDSSVILSASHQGFIGGLVGLNESGTIINSFSRGTIGGIGDDVIAGGIAGKNMTNSSYVEDLTTSKKGNIINCYTTMQITADTKGAVVGLNVNQDGSSTYTNNVNSMENRYVGVYYIYDTSVAYRDIYWTSTALSSNVDIDNYKLVTGLTFAQAIEQGTYLTYGAGSTSGTDTLAWDFANVWQIESGVNEGLPTLIMMGMSVPDNIYDPQSPYDETITNETQLSQIANDMNGTYEIGDSFILTSDWTSIGTAGDPFNGILDGKNYVITVGTGVDFNSLFGYLGPNAQIINVRIIGANIANGNNVGILTNYNNGLIQDCYVAGNITITGNIDKNIGGMVGLNSTSGKISGGSSSVNITSTVYADKVYSIGGIAGLNNGLIQGASTSSTATINVTNSAGTVYAGGIVGQNASTGSLKLCNNYCDVIISTTSENSFAGGIAGYNNYRATLILCRVGDNATVTESNRVTITSYWVGGLVGYNSGDDTNSFVSIKQCQVNQTVVISGVNAGGLVGRMYRGVMSNCATFAYLSANTMAGFAVTVEGYTGSSGNGKYAVIDICFSSATFNGSAGTVHSETTSYIRATNNFLYCAMRGEDTSNPSSYKVAGYINNSKYNKTNLDSTGQSEHSYRQYSSAYIGSWNWETPKDGATSNTDCKKSSTFDLTKWSTDIWQILDGQYPQLKF